jgi:hypothetical protein
LSTRQGGGKRRVVTIILPDAAPSATRAARGVALDQAFNHHGGDGRAGDACSLPFRLGGDAEQQQALGDAEPLGLRRQTIGLRRQASGTDKKYPIKS